MELKDYKDPRVALVAISILGAGTFLGWTFEPAEMTELRVQNATLKERTTNLEAQVQSLGERIVLLENISEGCREVLIQCKENR
jgi:cell division protein FtsB